MSPSDERRTHAAKLLLIEVSADEIETLIKALEDSIEFAHRIYGTDHRKVACTPLLERLRALPERPAILRKKVKPAPTVS